MAVGWGGVKVWGGLALETTCPLTRGKFPV